MTKNFIKELTTLLGSNCLTDPADKILYGYDNSGLDAKADVIALPSNTNQVVDIVKIAKKYNVPITTRGSATNTCGATVPLNGGIVLSTQHLNKIITINNKNRYAIVEPGVINNVLQQELSKTNMFWPPDPGSAKICTIGGNIGCNSAGPSAVKYGVTRDHVLGLTFVTGDAEIIKTGVYTTKGVVGYDLTRLLIGSQGTLGIVTEAILKISAKPKFTHTLCAHFNSIESATETIILLMQQQFTPSALELLDTNCINLIKDDPKLQIPDNSKACLIIEVDGNQKEVTICSEIIYKLTKEQTGCIQSEIAELTEDRQRLWRARKALSPKLKYIAPHKINEDVAVPINELPVLIHYIEKLSQEYQINIVNFGHAGNGNIHVNLLINPDDLKQKSNAELCLDKIFTKVIELKGTLSGEHGIGITKASFIKRELSMANINLMQNIKLVFDPHNILNPQLMQYL